MFYDNPVECPVWGSISITDWSATMNLYCMESNLSYREELRRREPGRIDPRYRGGAYGCPGDYFRGARAEDCRPVVRAQCEGCWEELYQDEEWIAYDERFE